MQSIHSCTPWLADGTATHAWFHPGRTDGGHRHHRPARHRGDDQCDAQPGSRNDGKARADVAVLEQALETYRLDNLSYPSTEQGLQALLDPPSGLTRPERYRHGGYIRRLPEDPWGHAYQYRRPGRNGGFDVYSLGADGAEGGDADNADIGNWR